MVYIQRQQQRSAAMYDWFWLALGAVLLFFFIRGRRRARPRHEAAVAPSHMASVRRQYDEMTNAGRSTGRPRPASSAPPLGHDDEPEENSVLDIIEELIPERDEADERGRRDERSRRDSGGDDGLSTLHLQTTDSGGLRRASVDTDDRSCGRSHRDDIPAGRDYGGDTGGDSGGGDGGGD